MKIESRRLEQISHIQSERSSADDVRLSFADAATKLFKASFLEFLSKVNAKPRQLNTSVSKLADVSLRKLHGAI